MAERELFGLAMRVLTSSRNGLHLIVAIGLATFSLCLLAPSAAESDSPLRSLNGSFPNLRLPQPVSALEEQALSPQDLFKECAVCPEMIVVPAGDFVMGAPDGEADSQSNERPQHTVSIRHAFAVGRFAVTFAEWDACVSAGVCKFRPTQGFGQERMPVLNLYWHDAQDYVWWLSNRTGRPYRLLSEAEREYVTRAGVVANAYWWGDTISAAEANYNGVRFGAAESNNPLLKRPVPVDSFRPNAWGLYQVHGNVYEWVMDCWNETYNGAPTDGSAWVEGECHRRVLRGGSWSRGPESLRSAARIGMGSDMRMFPFSMRVARTLKNARP
jgi:formylglycine-generating enzyme required for sulfatase activity